VKVFNSSVEKRVEKTALKMKSLVPREVYAVCTIVVQLPLKFFPIYISGAKFFSAGKFQYQ